MGEDPFPHAAFGPAPEAVVERLFRTVDMFRAIAPATTALQSLDNPGKHALTRCGTEMEEAKASCRWVVRAQPERRATVSKEGLAGEGEAEPSSSPLSWGVVRRPCRRAIGRGQGRASCVRDRHSYGQKPLCGFRCASDRARPEGDAKQMGSRLTYRSTI